MSPAISTIGERMKLAVCSLALLAVLGAGCGSGTKVEVVNEFGVDLTDVSVSFGSRSASWNRIEPGDAVSTRLLVPQQGCAVVHYSCGEYEMTDSLEMPRNASAASRISIYLADGSTTLRYSF